MSAECWMLMSHSPASRHMVVMRKAAGTRVQRFVPLSLRSERTTPRGQGASRVQEGENKGTSASPTWPSAGISS